MNDHETSPATTSRIAAIHLGAALDELEAQGITGPAAIDHLYATGRLKAGSRKVEEPAVLAPPPIWVDVLILIVGLIVLSYFGLM